MVSVGAASAAMLSVEETSRLKPLPQKKRRYRLKALVRARASYMLTVDLVYDDLALGPTVMNIGVVPFTVVGAPVPPVPLPAFDGYGRTVLLLLVAGLGISTLRPRRAGQAHRSQ